MQNFNPIYTLTPNVGTVKLSTASSLVRSDGSGSAIGTDLFLAFSAGASGSYVQRVRFNSVASVAATAGVATSLRVYLSTLNTGTTNTSNTNMLAEISVPAVSSAHSTNASNYFEVPLNIAIPANRYILVSQHVAQTTNQQWQAMVFGGDY